MIIFYTHKYNNERGESRNLLTMAVAAYSSWLRQPGSIDPATCDLLSGAGYPANVLAADISSIEIREEDLTLASQAAGALRTAGEFGKPYIPGFAPFSVSHSGITWAVLIMEPDDTDRSIGNDMPGTGAQPACGLDIQYERRANAASIAGRFFAPEDADAIRSDDDFFRAWTRREALVKAIGTSVAATNLPPAGGDTAEYQGVSYTIMDIELPPDESAEAGASDTPRLHAAICVNLAL